MAKLPVEPSVWAPPKAPARAKQATGATSAVIESFALPGPGGEDVVIDDQGRVITGLADGRIVRLSQDGTDPEVVGDTGGRPLGIEIDPDGILTICDARRGVLRLDPATGKVSPVVETVAGHPLTFCNNNAISTDGTVYFSDSSRHFGIDNWKDELFAHSGTGRLLRRSPDGAVDVVLDGLQFANGVALAADGSFVVVAQTTGYSLERVWLTGPQEGKRDVFVDNLPGFPDNISTGSDGLIWVALASPRDSTLDMLLPRSPAIRKVAARLPDALQPQPKKTTWVQAFAADGTLVHDVQQTLPDFYMATGVRESGGTVWLGSLRAPTLARFRLA